MKISHGFIGTKELLTEIVVDPFCIYLAPQVGKRHILMTLIESLIISLMEINIFDEELYNHVWMHRCNLLQDLIKSPPPWRLKFEVTFVVIYFLQARYIYKVLEFEAWISLI